MSKSDISDTLQYLVLMASIIIYPNVPHYVFTWKKALAANNWGNCPLELS